MPPSTTAPYGIDTGSTPFRGRCTRFLSGPWTSVFEIGVRRSCLAFMFPVLSGVNLSKPLIRHVFTERVSARGERWHGQKRHFLQTMAILRWLSRTPN